MHTRRAVKTSVSETIRKLPLVNAQTAFKKTVKKMAKNDFQYGGWNYYTLQYGRTGGSGMTCHGIR